MESRKGPIQTCYTARAAHWQVVAPTHHPRLAPAPGMGEAGAPNMGALITGLLVATIGASAGPLLGGAAGASLYRLAIRPFLP